MDAVILAGGLGTRLRSVVSDIPKCMAPVGSRPFLSILLDQLAQHKDIQRVVLSVGYLREVIFDYVRTNCHKYPFSIVFSVEETPLGTGGGLKLALKCCTSDKVLVLNGDTYFDIDIPSLEQACANATIALSLKWMTDFDRYGAVNVNEDGAINEFCEKRHCQHGLINGGVYMLQRSLLDMNSLPDKFSFETNVLEPLAGTGKLRASVQDGYFIDIGIPDDYAVAQLRWGEWETLLLDRDGVINTHIDGDYVKCWDEFEFRPRFLELSPYWATKFKHIIVVTNQRGVGRGIMSAGTLDEIHDRMTDEIRNAGGRIDAIYCCTATEDSNPRRKPNTGMWEEIKRDFPDIHESSSVMLGDSPSDLAFADNCGIYGIKINW